MSDEPDLTCPTCGKQMEALTVEEGSTPSNLLRVCPFCATLAWNNEDGTIETRPPQAVEGEERDELLRDRKFVSAAEELDRLKGFGPRIEASRAGASGSHHLTWALGDALHELRGTVGMK